MKVITMQLSVKVLPPIVEINETKTNKEQLKFHPSLEMHSKLSSFKYLPKLQKSIVCMIFFQCKKNKQETVKVSPKFKNALLIKLL